MSNERKNKDANYMAKVSVQTENGIIDYDPDKMKDIEGGEKLTYDEYIEIQEKSAGKVRGSFQLCYYYVPLGFKGQIEKKNDKNVCFKRIHVDGMYSDGICFEGKEEHVWMDLKGFEDYQVGDSVSFCAEIYRYLKTGNGKMIDFGLRNPQHITKIEPYKLPSDDELLRQEVELMVCETCFLSEHCTGFCLLPKGAKKAKVDFMFHAVKSNQISNRDEVF